MVVRRLSIDTRACCVRLWTFSLLRSLPLIYIVLSPVPRLSKSIPSLQSNHCSLASCTPEVGVSRLGRTTHKSRTQPSGVQVFARACLFMAAVGAHRVSVGDPALAGSCAAVFFHLLQTGGKHRVAPCRGACWQLAMALGRAGSEWFPAAARHLRSQSGLFNPEQEPRYLVQMVQQYSRSFQKHLCTSARPLCSQEKEVHLLRYSGRLSGRSQEREMARRMK